MKKQPPKPARVRNDCYKGFPPLVALLYRRMEQIKMNFYEKAVLETDIRNQHNVLDSLKHRLENIDNETEENLCKLAIRKEEYRLNELNQKLEGAK